MSMSRPVLSSALTARNKSGEAACTESLKALPFTGSFTGEELTSLPPTSTSLNAPAATTPLRRRSRAGASQGMALGSTIPVVLLGLALTKSSVAASWSNWVIMRLPAVRVRPSVATSAVSPMTTPRTVSTIRPGLANIPAIASFRRSRIEIPDRDRVVFTAATGELVDLFPARHPRLRSHRCSSR